VQASGGTEMARGMEQVLEQMYRSTYFGGVRRLILLTDGQTYGDDNRCVELARQAQGAEIGITALGVGEEWNEDLLATMAAHGNSRSEYIAGSEAITEIFRDEMRLLQGIVAQEMSLTLRKAEATVQNFVRVAPEVSQMALKESWNKDQAFPLGEWMGTDVQSFLVEMTVPPLPPGNHRLLQVTFTYRLPRERSRREVDYDLALPCVPDAEAGEVPDKVHRALEKVTALRLQEAAWQDVRRGNVDQATRRLEAAATRLVKMGEEDLARAVEAEAQRLQHTGRTSLIGKKEIRYGTQRLGRQSGRQNSRE
jgi:Ca-activated chloride channel family protein